MESSTQTINLNPENKYIYHLFEKIRAGKFDFSHNSLANLDDWFFEKAAKNINLETEADADFIDFTAYRLFVGFLA